MKSPLAVYFMGMTTDGTRLDGEEVPRFRAHIGRVAAYFYKREKNQRYLLTARRMIAIRDQDPLAEKFFADALAGRIHLLMDVYDLTKDRGLLNEAGRYADQGVAGLLRGGLFARRVGDPFYESKDGIGNFVAGLLRIHLVKTGKPVPGGTIDWSY